MELSRQDIDALRLKAEEAGILGVRQESVLDTEAAIARKAPPRRGFARRVSPDRVAAAEKSEFSLTHSDLERMMGLNDLVEENYLLRALRAAKPIMRVVLRAPSGREMGYASGFMVSKRLLLTNHHVFPTVEMAGYAVVDANYVNDLYGRPARSHRFKARPDLFFANHKDLDWALVAIEETSDDGAATLDQFGYHRLIPQSNKIQSGEFVTLIQHPSGQRRQVSIRENQFVKYHEDFLWYKSDTAPGSSGSPCFNDSFQVVGLHHRGVPEQNEEGEYVLVDGTTVDSLKGIAEGAIAWAANAGVRVSKICESFEAKLPANDPFTLGFYAAMNGGDVFSGTHESDFEPETGSTSPVMIGKPTAIPGGVLIPLNLRVSVGIEGATAAIPPTAVPPPSTTPQALPAADALPAIEEKIPFIVRDYSDRKGYQSNFLGPEVPLPKMADKEFVSRMDDGEFEIPYEHFTVVLNRKRRLAFFTAANVSNIAAEREPEPGKDYTRDGLRGFEDAQETWITDSRVPTLHQLPDRFYNKDRKAFDKGHIVQRDSICWGSSYDQIRKANGDTYHVTNCSPQTSQYNQSSRGKDNWGDLESEIMKQSKAEKLCVFSGPIFAADDPLFVGVDDFGKVQIGVPRRYWKVVVAVKDGALEAFGFVLEQDLANVEFEFFVPDGWKKKRVSIAVLQELLGPVKLPSVVIDADRFQAG